MLIAHPPLQNMLCGNLHLVFAPARRTPVRMLIERLCLRRRQTSVHRRRDPLLKLLALHKRNRDLVIVAGPPE